MDFLNLVEKEMMEWMMYPTCYFHHNSKNIDDSQAVLNFMRLSNNLPTKRYIVPHRRGLFNSVGYEGSLIYESKIHFYTHKGYTIKRADEMPYEGATFQDGSNRNGDDGTTEGNTWLDVQLQLTDKDGFFINKNLERSAIVHEYMAFGKSFEIWFDNFLHTDT